MIFENVSWAQILIVGWNSFKKSYLPVMIETFCKFAIRLFRISRNSPSATFFSPGLPYPCLFAHVVFYLNSQAWRRPEAVLPLRRCSPSSQVPWGRLSDSRVVPQYPWYLNIHSFNLKLCILTLFSHFLSMKVETPNYLILIRCVLFSDDVHSQISPKVRGGSSECWWRTWRTEWYGFLIQLFCLIRWLF